MSKDSHVRVWYGQPRERRAPARHEEVTLEKIVQLWHLAELGLGVPGTEQCFTPTE